MKATYQEFGDAPEDGGGGGGGGLVLPKIYKHAPSFLFLEMFSACSRMTRSASTALA